MYGGLNVLKYLYWIKIRCRRNGWRTARSSFLYHFFKPNRYRRKRPKVDASIFDSVLSHISRSDASEKKKRKKRVHFSTFSPVDKFRVLACIGYLPQKASPLKWRTTALVDEFGVSDFIVSDSLQDLSKLSWASWELSATHRMAI